MDARPACMVRLWNQYREERKLTSGLIHLNLPAIVAQLRCCTLLQSPISVVRLQRSDLSQMDIVQTNCSARQQTLCKQGAALPCIGLSQAELAKQLLRIAPAMPERALQSKTGQHRMSVM